MADAVLYIYVEQKRLLLLLVDSMFEEEDEEVEDEGLMEKLIGEFPAACVVVRHSAIVNVTIRLLTANFLTFLPQLLRPTKI